MGTDIKQALRTLFEETMVKGNIAAYDEICGAGYRSHDPLGGEMDLEHAKELSGMLRSAFPDLSVTILGSYEDGDTAIMHWRMTGTHQKSLMGMTPTGKRLTTEGITLGKFRNGKLVEDWTQWDAVGILRDLGVTQGMVAGAVAQAAPAGERPQPTQH